MPHLIDYKRNVITDVRQIGRSSRSELCERYCGWMTLLLIEMPKIQIKAYARRSIGHGRMLGLVTSLSDVPSVRKC